MKIAFITPEFVTEKYFSGGLANYLNRVTKALAQAGHDVHVITLTTKEDAHTVLDGVHVHSIRTGRWRGYADKLTGNRISETIKWFAFSHRAYRYLEKLHRDSAFDIVQFPNSRACGFLASLFLKIPYVVRISSYRPLWNKTAGIKQDLDNRLSEWLETLQLRRARFIYGPSNTLKGTLKKEAGMDIRVLRTPFFLETKSSDESVYEEKLKGKRYLLFFGRFQLHKGFHILAQALPEVLKQHRDLHAVMVGLDTGSYLNPSMTAYAKDLCKTDADRLIFIDQIHHDKLYPVIRRAQFVVLPSLTDNLPNACLEAMALGRPVIGTRGASFDELLTDGVSGFLLDIGDVKGLTDKMNEVAGRKDLDAIGQRAQQSMRRFDPQYTVAELVSFYRNIIAVSAGGRATLKENIFRFINECYAGQIGEYRQSPGGQVTLYASCYAVMMLHYLDLLKDLEPAVKAKWAEYINSFQDEQSGIFVGPELVASELHSKMHDMKHLQMHLTAHVLPALALLGAKTKYPLSFAHAYMQPDNFKKWAATINWKNAWFEGNNILFVGQFLIHLRDKENLKQAQPAIDLYFEWLNMEMDPKTGLWGTNGHCSAFEAMCGGYHQLLLYYSENRDVPYKKQLVDTVLALQHIDGGFAQGEGGGACEDVDAIDILVNMYKRSDYRRKDIRIALRKAYQSIMQKQKPDGGFVYRNNEAFSHMGMEKTKSAANVSNMFATWFRLHTIALIKEVLGNEILPTMDFKFNEVGSMGWHGARSEQKITCTMKLQECVQARLRNLSNVRWHIYQLKLIKRGMKRALNL